MRGIYIRMMECKILLFIGSRVASFVGEYFDFRRVRCDLCPRRCALFSLRFIDWIFSKEGIGGEKVEYEE